MIKIRMMIAGRYEIIEKIGTGGMSDVYKAIDHKLNRPVAVKVLKQEFAENENFVSKFRVEAQAAANLMHTNIVNVYDVGVEEGIHYIVMELVEGVTLKEYIGKKIRLSVREAISIAIQISSGIEAAHRNHIIHRDIKPQNIIISKDGKVKVTDFGIAKAATSNTITSNVMGSVHYTSPEQARGGYSDERSDIYSLGITLFEMLTGRLPFNGETTVAIAIKHIQDPMPSPRDFAEDIPISMEQIVAKCCQKSPDRRYQSMAELTADLKEAFVNPDSNFVQVTDPDEEAKTRDVSEADLEKIRSSTKPVEDDRVKMRLKPEYLETEEEWPTGKVSKGSRKGGSDYDEDRSGRREDGRRENGNGRRDDSRRDDGRRDDVRRNDGRRDDGRRDDGRRGDNRNGGGKRNGSNSRSYDDYDDYQDGYSEDDYYQDDYERDEYVPQKRGGFDKLVTIGAIVVAIMVALLILFFVGRSAGLFGGEGTKEEIDQTEGSLLPDLAGMTLDEAKRQLIDLGLTPEIEYVENREVAQGTVLSTSPEAGSSVSADQNIVLRVSAGTTMLDVPNVTGKTLAEARSTLETFGFVVQVEDATDTNVEAGYIASQNPAGESGAPAGSTVIIYVSNGTTDQNKVRVPDVRGKTEMDAMAILTETGLTVGPIAETSYTDPAYEGLICGQDPAPGSYAEKGSKVNLQVSIGVENATYRYQASIDAPTEDPDYQSGVACQVILAASDGTILLNTNTSEFPVSANLTGIKSSTGVITITFTITSEDVVNTDPESGETYTSPGESREKVVRRDVEFIQE